MFETNSILIEWSLYFEVLNIYYQHLFNITEDLPSSTPRLNKSGRYVAIKFYSKILKVGYAL